jgi:phosphate-selective porin OprO/OprP
MPRYPSRAAARILPLTLALTLAAPFAHAEQPLTVEDLTARLKALEARLGVSGDDTTDASGLNDLDKRLRVIERRLELQAEENAAKAAKDPVVSLAAAKGLSVKSPDGLELKVRGLVQADSRVFIGDDRVPQNDTFLFRRIRPTLEGTWGRVIGFRLTPEFAGDSATIVDAYVDLKFDPRATVRIGKVKGPVGLERLQSGGAIALVERGFPTELAPNRDLGVQLQGELFSSRLNYVVGVYNGAPDGRDAATTNPDNEFDYAGRVFWEPFKNSANALSGLGIGVAASVGESFGAGNNFLPRYRTPAQTQFFAYNTNVAADGLHRRFSPQGYFYRGRYGVLGEYITSEHEVRVTSGVNSGRRDHLESDAYQITASVVLTGEDASYRGVAKPNHPFTSDGAGWGAFELVGRIGELNIDDDAFPRFANIATSARSANAWTVGLNWYLNSNLKLVTNYTHTTFEGGAAAGADREDEKSIFTRAQFSF